MSGKKKAEQGFACVAAFGFGCWQLYWLITAWGVSQWGWNRPSVLPIKTYQSYVAAPAFYSWAGLSIIASLVYILFLSKVPTEHRWVVFGYAMALAVGSLMTSMFMENMAAGYFMMSVFCVLATAIRPNHKSVV